MENEKILKPYFEESKQNKKRSIAHKLATNVKRQSLTGKNSQVRGLTSNVSDQLSRRISRIENEDDIVDSLYRNELNARNHLTISSKPHENNCIQNKFKLDVYQDGFLNKNNTNNNQSARQSKHFKRTVSTNGLNRNFHKEHMAENEDSSEEINHDSYDSDVDVRQPSRDDCHWDFDDDLEQKHNSLSGLDLYNISKKKEQLEKLSRRLDHILPPSSTDVCRMAGITSNQFNSTPNIATSKDYFPSSKYSWSPMGKKVDNEDEAPSIESSKMTSASSVLSGVSTEKIRNRGYLAGSTNLGLLGNDELSRLFPERRMRCYAITWNVGELKNIPTSLDDLLLPSISEVAFDVYAIGIQEAVFDRQEWYVKIQETLGPYFVLYHSACHGTLFLAIFLRRDLIWFLSVPEESVVTTRAGPSSIKTKGAVAIAFILFGTSFLFINSHFKAHEGKAEERIENYKKISSSLNFTKISRTKYQQTQDGASDIATQFDCTFWLGDLNSRMEMKKDRIEGTMVTGELKPQEIEKLMQFDELQRLRMQGLAFGGFSEGRIQFLPTFKFDVGTNNYDSSSKNRNPSYTDRILFKCRKKGSIFCLHYNSIPSLQFSDHKPVYGIYEVELRPGIDSMPLSGGQFNKDVWLAGTKKRMAHQTNGNQRNGSSVCMMM